MVISVQQLPTSLVEIRTLLDDTDMPDYPVTVQFEDGTTVTLRLRMILWNLILNYPWFAFNIPLTANMFKVRPATKNDVLSAVWSEQYAQLLKLGIPGIQILVRFWYVLDIVQKIIREHFGAYQQSMSMLSLARIWCTPQIQELVKPIDNVGTDAMEKILNQRSKALTKLLLSDEIPNNVLRPFQETASLKDSQSAQTLLAYGPRADLDDSICSHTVQNSAMSGLANVQDFLIETLSAKKASFFSKVMICDTQYFARVLRLHAMPLGKQYKGHCGNTQTVPIQLPEDRLDNYLDKIVFLDGQQYAITPETLDLVKGKKVMMISPTMCRHTDGVCEYCCGRASGKPWEYMPPDHIGIYSATKVGRAVSQMVLSTKHLLKTKTLMYSLTQQLKEYFVINESDIHLKESMVDKLNKCKIRIPVDFLGHLNDLEHGVQIDEQFSEIKYIDLIFPNGDVQHLVFETEHCIPYFASTFLKHLNKVSSRIEVTEDEEYVIPLAGFGSGKPLMRFTVINDDMIAFTELVERMLKNNIHNYTTITSALQDFAKILYSKTSINIFFVELLLKSFMRTSRDNPHIGAIENTDNVCFGNMKDNISDRSVSVKLGHERLGIKARSENYFAELDTHIVPKEPGLLDAFFGF
jgi:hypothetical protein